MGSLEIIQRRVAAGRLDSLEHLTSAARTSAEQGADYVRRLLISVNRQPLVPVRVDANAVLMAMKLGCSAHSAPGLLPM